MNITALLIQLISGGVGGNIVGAILKKLNLGPVGNSIAGIVGGIITGQLLRLLGPGGATAVGNAATAAAGSAGMGSLLANVGGAGLGGAVLTAIIGAIKGRMATTS